MVGGVEWADLEVRAWMVLPALHQVELKRDIQDIKRRYEKTPDDERMLPQLISKCWDLNAFHSDLVGRVVRASDGLLPVKHRHIFLSLRLVASKLTPSLLLLRSVIKLFKLGRLD